MTATAENLFLLDFFRALCGSVDRATLTVPEASTWEECAGRVIDHGLLPQLAELLARAPPRGFPGELAAAVRNRQRGVAFDHLAGLATVDDVRRALAAGGIPFLVLKGPALAIQLYGREARRVYNDVDVLVRPADREAAVAALAAASYRARGGPLLQRLLRRAHFHLVLLPDRGGRLKVELHWSLVDRANLYRIDEEEVFARRRELAPGGFPVLSIEDELLYLAVHLAKHGLSNTRAMRRGRPPEWFCDLGTGNCLSWFFDIHGYLRRHGNDLDWAALKRRAERWNVLEDVAATFVILELLAADGVSRRAREALEVEAAPVAAGKRTARGDRRETSSLGGRLRRRALAMQPDLAVRPVRLLHFGRTLFPKPSRLRDYYAGARWRWLPWLYLRHPFHMLRKTLGS